MLGKFVGFKAVFAIDAIVGLSMKNINNSSYNNTRVSNVNINFKSRKSFSKYVRTVFMFQYVQIY